MAQKTQLINALKKELKSEGVRYGDIAKLFEVSLGTIKRRFSTYDFSVDHMDRMCEMINIEISDLVLRMNKDRAQTESLTEEQEQELVSDIKLLLTAYLLTSNWSVEEILYAYDIDALLMTQYLAKLDRMKLIDLFPGDKVKLRISRSFNWIKNGPIESFFKENVQSQFFDADFKGPGEVHVFVSGMLSKKSNEELQDAIKRLVSIFDNLHQSDEIKSLSEKFGTSMVLAMRPWDMNLFESFRKLGTEKKF